MNPHELCTLNKEQEKLWAETRVALSWHCPAFTHIFMTMLNGSGSKYIAMFTKSVPIAATDGESLILNPDTFFKFSLPKRLFIVAHEIMHCVFNHCVIMYNYHQAGYVTYSDGKKLPYSQELMNVALDYIINDVLIDAKVGEFDKEWLHKPELVTKADSGVDAYRKLFKSQPPPPPQGSPSKQPPDLTSAGNNQKGFDEHLKPGESQGKNPVEASNERSDARWQVEIAAAANLQKLAGKNTPGLEQLFKEILTPVVDWTDKLKATMARKLGSDRYEWRKPDRRLIVRDIYAPSRSGHGCGTVVIAVDTSGSIVSNPKQLDAFMAEVYGILSDAKPRELVILWCDAAIHNVDPCETVEDLNVIRRRGVGGGGGTDFRPVFEWISDNQVEPDTLVFLTDGLGDFPSYTPKHPTIWGWVPERGYKVNFPFGDVIEIPKQA